MISFSCSNCGVKFRVKAELAGRSGTCPSCQQPLVVPAAVDEVAAPTGELTGQASSLQRAGLDVTVSLQSSADDSFAAASLAQLVPESSRPTSRYVIEKEIARGGMGAVVRAMDCDIRREVAIKFMLDPDDAAKKARFVEEAQITGQLEHPNIVPIHELGLDAEQRLFFAMKMVRGRSLAEILAGLRDVPAEYEPDWPLSRLLNILVNICNALGYAHSRGVIHRDLKPANIMVGDFGEVYVMDWGLAKVLRPNDAPSTNSTPPQSLPALLAPSGSAPTSSGSHTQQIYTTRELDGELTQDGAIMGTLGYMPPEQARGEIQSLDARTDIYSIGAMLYEILTLLSPIEREGGNIAILMRVVEGRIQPPAQRAPHRAKQGYIPKELAAIAMKALARRPADRYPSCAELRQDLERFQAGRSVSAKADSAWELLQKLVKRNRAASVAIAVATIVLLTFAAIFLKFNRDARLLAESAQALAEKNYTDFQNEQQAKNDAIRNSIPGTLRAARQLANDGAVDEALKQIALVRQYEPKNLEAALLRGLILTAQRNWPEAVQELDFYLQQNRTDKDAVTLYRLASTGKTDDLVTLYEAANVLQRQHLFSLTPLLLQDAATLLEARKPLAALYDKQTKEIYGVGVELRKNGELLLNLSGKNLRNVNGLKGMQLNEINLAANPELVDLEGLRGMPLLSLGLYNCTALASLEPLRGMKLRKLECFGCVRIIDLEPLRHMPLEDLKLTHTAVSDLSPLTGMPLRRLIANCPLDNIEPLRGMQIEQLVIGGQFRDLEPLRGMPCTELHLDACGGLTSLEPLRGMPCRKLTIYACAKIDSLEPLQGMPCTYLNLYRTPGRSLEPLRGMPLEVLSLDGNEATDLSPLADLPLVELTINAQKPYRGIDVLRSVKSLKRINANPVGMLSPAEFWRRYDAGEFKPK